MNKGIICFETGEFEAWNTKDMFHALPLLQFLKEAWDVEFIYRQIVTEQELAYYINKIGEQHFKNKYGIVYFSFHGRPESICLKGSKEDITLEKLAEMATANDSFEGRDVHFSSCETFDCDEDAIRRFKRETKARSVSGYTKEVDSVSAYINELAYFDQLIRFATPATVRRHMADYTNQLAKLGFRMV